MSEAFLLPLLPLLLSFAVEGTARERIWLIALIARCSGVNRCGA